ncbi:C39 family peptidase [Streptomyces albidus (ex Kaewkla and Franco 2022)]|uniref:C39 family peptidase n=1 Tax=Streptomyces albidus (ex Kaewkla and Franco 2022) TaxID=722709 RepID=UPI0015EFAB6D|nr:C39 family peptidase [Streptomyces albidus (ex Kaewkla and Franco 2022)]
MRIRSMAASVALAATGLLAVPGVANADEAHTAAVSQVAAEPGASAPPVEVSRQGSQLHTEATETKAAKTLEVDYQVQETGYWCGPAATRIALSARMGAPSQADLAAQLGTTENGTDDISQVTSVLNANLGTGWYESKYMPDDPPSQAQKDLLWQDVVGDIDNNYPLVTNIVAPPGNQPPGYPSDQTIYHYFTVIGYDDANRTVLIADPASFSGNQIYWLTFDQLASLIPPKGYAA